MEGVQEFARIPPVQFLSPLKAYLKVGFIGEGMELNLMVVYYIYSTVGGRISTKKGMLILVA